MTKTEQCGPYHPKLIQLPRSRDFGTTWPLQTDVKNIIWQGLQNGFTVWKSYKTFLEEQRNNQPQELGDKELLANDGLYLTEREPGGSGNNSNYA